MLSFASIASRTRPKPGSSWRPSCRLVTLLGSVFIGAFSSALQAELRTAVLDGGELFISARAANEVRRCYITLVHDRSKHVIDEILWTGRDEAPRRTRRIVFERDLVEFAPFIDLMLFRFEDESPRVASLRSG